MATDDTGSIQVPKRPANIDDLAEACLDALSASGMGRWLSIGGAFGLSHYFEYRTTHDVDAWWNEKATTEDRAAVVRALEKALATFGTVRTRAWGDVVSVDVRVPGRAAFSFQIATRSARLADPVEGPWPGIQIDAFSDLLASKMTALVERGAPRDFLDIFTLCQNALTTPKQCWDLWLARQRAAGENDDRARAELAVQSHLARIVGARPLDQIIDDDARSAAETLRRWYREEMLRGLAD